jgi:hypothetical protein
MSGLGPRHLLAPALAFFVLGGCVAYPGYEAPYYGAYAAPAYAYAPPPVVAGGVIVGGGGGYYGGGWGYGPRRTWGYGPGWGHGYGRWGGGPRGW